MFQYSEPLNTISLNSIPNEFRINDDTIAEILLIRIITGTVSLSANNYQYSSTCRVNYSTLPSTRNNRLSSKPIKECFTSIDLDSIVRLVKKRNVANNNYFKSILNELAHLTYNTDKNNYVTAFVHLYRLLEFISYTFPLLHTSTSDNFYGTFDALKSYFKGDGGELKFLIRFVKKLFDERPELGLTVDFSIPGIDTNEREKIYRNIKNILRNKNYIEFDDTLYQFSFEYENLIDFIVFIRNRYFHFATGSGMKNIRTSDIIDPNSFFKMIVPHSTNWILYIYIEILKQQIE